MKTIGSLSLGLGVATDVVIAVSLCIFLRGLRTGHRQCVCSPIFSVGATKLTRVSPALRDDSMVNALIVYALSTGGLTAYARALALD